MRQWAAGPSLEADSHTSAENGVYPEHFPRPGVRALRPGSHATPTRDAPRPAANEPPSATQHPTRNAPAARGNAAGAPAAPPDKTPANLPDNRHNAGHQRFPS